MQRFYYENKEVIKIKNSKLQNNKSKLLEAISVVADERDDVNGLESRKQTETLILQYLNKNDDEYRKQLLNLYNQGKPLTGKDGIRRLLGAYDLEFFGKAYLNHFFSKPSPKFHTELDNIWVSGVLKNIVPSDNKNARLVNQKKGTRKAVLAPRGHAKSTNLTFKSVLHSVLYKYKNYVIIISDTYDQAKSFVQSIRDELEDNENILEDFGDLVGNVWREDVIVTTSKIKIQAKGSAQKMRGLKHKQWRPDLIVLDDIENDKLVKTVEQRESLKNWFYKAVSKCGDSYTDFIYIGTLLHYDSLLANVSKNPTYQSVKYKAVISFNYSTLWDKWREIFTDLNFEDNQVRALNFFENNKEEMLEGTEVLWNEKNTYYDLMVEKIEIGDSAFNSEMQNEPINLENCLFPEEIFDYYNPYDIDFGSDDFKFYGFIDPSLGKTKKSDFSVIITMAVHKNGYMYVVDASVERRHPDVIIEDTINKAIWLQRTYGKKYYKFGIETNQFQWYLKEVLAKASAKYGVYLPICEVHQTSDKKMRIETLQPDIKNKYIKFDKRHTKLIEQLKYYPMAEHDDAPDALEGCRSLISGKKNKMIVRSRRGWGI